jgi:hypothetical protein
MSNGRLGISSTNTLGSVARELVSYHGNDPHNLCNLDHSEGVRQDSSVGIVTEKSGFDYR